MKTTTTNTASFKLSLQGTQNTQDTAERTIAFDVPNTVTASQVATAADLFVAAGMSNVFQPTGWRDYEGNDEVYKITGVTGYITEKTVTELDPVTPA